ncbi:heme biosynthesis operon protein HemX [Psychromonas marina]|uniref:Heme biosynthesis operon protein HemX n=1 Tax=Psychromonas marina TaxID=88364 RepID=A0ABQ6DZL1_9GAMM|nr:uroporphyrinogen-III C-methyltransferase [Psychromonas marina]GLS90596.1 heme biosynthesis operon protein HemX [Psychromonas marina]
MTEIENKIEQDVQPVIPQTDSQKSSKRALGVALLSLFLIIFFMITVFYFHKSNNALVVAQQQQIESLSKSVATQSAQQKTQSGQSLQTKASLEAQLEKVNLQLQQVNNVNKIVKTDIQSLQRSFSASTIRHPNDWILAEVEYLISLSGRKIWLENDTKTAISLLVAADQRIVELNDASLSPLRGALLDDINKLEALPNLDTDGVILTLTSLDRTVDKLRSTSLLMPDASENNDTEVSSDINDWSANLTKSWHVFIDSFITVNKRDSKVEALLSPEQSWYLRENIRNNLSKAEFAIYRQQQDVYDIALQNTLTLLTTYYDLKDNTTGHFYKSIQRLSKRNVSIKYPDQLKSAPLLERVIEQRLKKSLASSNLK